MQPGNDFCSLTQRGTTLAYRYSKDIPLLYCTGSGYFSCISWAVLSSSRVLEKTSSWYKAGWRGFTSVKHFSVEISAEIFVSSLTASVWALFSTVSLASIEIEKSALHCLAWWTLEVISCYLFQTQILFSWRRNIQSCTYKMSLIWNLPDFVQ